MPKILVVEDDLSNQEIVVRFLRTLKTFTVVTAVNGPQGVELALSEKPDLILMDLGLPRPEDGLEATRQIRAQPATAEIPIIAFTAANMAQDRERAREAGCNDFVGKPFEFSRLKTTLELHLSRRTQTT
jgi:two-component system cell cycle response regulator DivK